MIHHEKPTHKKAHERSNVYYSESLYFELKDIVQGYLALEYSISIMTIQDHHMYPEYKAYFSDGFPVLLAKEAPGHRQFYLKMFLGKYVPDQTAVYDLHEIRKMFVQALSKQPITFKHTNPDEGIDAFKLFKEIAPNKHAYARIRHALRIVADFMFEKEGHMVPGGRVFDLTLGELSKIKRSDLMKYRNIGKRTADFIEDTLKKHNLSWLP